MRLSEITHAPMISLTEGFRDARSFGIWLTHLHYAMYPNAKDDGVTNYDYLDDRRGRPLRYRLMVADAYLAFIEQVLPQITKQGWHLTDQKKTKRNRWQLVFEPILTPRIARPGVYWHLTPTENISSVLHAGLRPNVSRHGLSYPQPRVYLIRDEAHAKLMADSFARRDSKPVTYGLIRVDLRKAKGITLHADPELAEVAVYTTQPVPVECLSLAQEKIG